MSRPDHAAKLKRASTREFLLQSVRADGDIERAARSAGLSKTIIEQHAPALWQELLITAGAHATKSINPKGN